jgi:hypothetical protein
MGSARDCVIASRRSTHWLDVIYRLPSCVFFLISLFILSLRSWLRHWHVSSTAQPEWHFDNRVAPLSVRFTP